MDKASQKALEAKSLGMAKVIGGSFLAVILAASLTAAQWGQTPANEQPAEQVAEEQAINDEVEAATDTPGTCSTASLSFTPNSKQMKCLLDVKAQYGTFDCQGTGWFETHLKTDIEQCETKVSACMSDKPSMQVQASAQKTSERKLPLIIKREPAKLQELGRAQPASETSSYFIQCDDKERAPQWAEK